MRLRLLPPVVNTRSEVAPAGTVIEIVAT